MAGPLRADEGFRPSYRPAPARKPGVDPELIRLGGIALAAGAGLAFLVAGVSMLGHGHRALPVIEADARPVRIKPADPGGMKVTGAELGGAGAADAPQLMPAAEQPELRALKAQVREMQKQLARQAAATAAALKLAQEQKLAQAQKAQEAAARAALAAKLAQAAPASAGVKIAEAMPAAKTPGAGLVASANVARAAAIAPIERPAPPSLPVQTLELPLVPPAGTQVQLGAFKDEAAAREKWSELVRQLPDILGGRVPDIAAASAAGQTLWRLRTGDFTDVAQAASFCQRLKAHAIACNVAAF